MKWESVTSTIGQSVFALWNNGKQLVTLAFNNASNAARIEFGDERRVFLLRKEGLFKTTTVLTNEYGIRIGHTGNIGQDNFVEFNNERFFYSVDESEKEIRIFRDANHGDPIAVCELSVEDKTESIVPQRKFSEKTYYSLLMTLCWYLFQPVSKSKLSLSAA
ncbi:MAG: hypothetical protein EOO05_19280 [Chitinophagaceae bacterium]|nr:MAG: hypothetical protein EOO05_19280 [Chitinophagaceae bacterium]